MPSKSGFYVARSVVGNLTRTRAADDPVLLHARRRMQEEAFLVAIERAINEVPGITAELRQRAIELLVDADGGLA